MNASLDLVHQVTLRFPDERKPLVFAVDARHGPVHEHQFEVLRVIAAELVEPPENGADPRERFERRADARRVAEEPESLLRKREEDVVLARKIAVDRRRAVLDPLGNFPNRDVSVPLGREKVAGSIEYGSTDSLAIPLLALFDSH